MRQKDLVQLGSEIAPLLSVVAEVRVLAKKLVDRWSRFLGFGKACPVQNPVHGKGVHVEAALFDFALRGVVFGERLLELLQSVARTQLSVLEQMEDLLGTDAHRYE